MSGVPTGLYVVGGDLPAPLPGAADALDAVVARDADRRLEDALAGVEALLTEAADDADQPLDPEVVALCEDACTRPGAVVELGSLDRHVQDGSLRWEEVWAHPQDHPGGVRLVGEVVDHLSG